MYFAIGENTAHKYFESNELQAVYRYLQARFPYRSKDKSVFPEPIHIRNDHSPKLSKKAQAKIDFLKACKNGEFLDMPFEEEGHTEMAIKELNVDELSENCKILVYDNQKGIWWTSITACAIDNGIADTTVRRRAQFERYDVISIFSYQGFTGTRQQIINKFRIDGQRFLYRLSTEEIKLIKRYLKECD